MNPSLIDQGTTLQTAGEYQQALECFTQAVQANPTSSAAWDHLAHVAALLGRSTDALAAIDRALALALANRGGEAVSAIDRALALDESHAANWLVKAMLLADLLRYSDALLALSLALAITPNDPELLSLQRQLQAANQAGLIVFFNRQVS